MKNTIDVIRPIRVDGTNDFLISRISNFKFDTDIPCNISFTVVDEGSDPIYKDRIREECEKHSVKFISLDKVDELFCPGRARNYGAMYSLAEYVFFQDLDLLPYDGFYRELTDQIRISNIDNDPDQFAMMPCVYLTEKGNEIYDGSLYKKKLFIRAAFSENEELVERYSTGTSACLYNRLRFLQLGGFDREFKAWGYEDLDLNCRFIRKSKLFPLPINWSFDKFNFNSVVEYEGWKAIYRLFGDINFVQGMTLFHAHHPIHKSRTGFKDVVEKNRRHFLDNLKKNVAITAIPDKNRGRSLVFKPCAFNVNNDVLPLLGDVIKVGSLGLKDSEQIINFIKNEKIDRVVFQNPYSDPLTEEVFEKCKANKINFVICERGALPDSCFFDDSGFLANSKYYAPEFWDRPLSALEKTKLNDYSFVTLNSEKSLEKQGKTATKFELKKKYNCLDKKIILVPLQRPDDTAVLKFKRKLSYPEYLKLVEELATTLENYCILVKKHPLEDEISGIKSSENLKIVESDENINSLILASDVVLTYTSGSGLLGLLAKKRVITVGNAFYSNNQLVKNADSLDDIRVILDKNCEISEKESDSMDRFINYLINNYYSFGSFKTREVKFENGKRITATTEILFRQLICFGKKFLYPNKRNVLITFSSGLFDRYRFWKRTTLIAERENLSKKTQAESVTSVGSELSLIENPEKTLGQRRLKKLRESPYRYFNESKWTILRLLAPLFKH